MSGYFLMNMQTEIVRIVPQDIAVEEIKRAARIIQKGGIVAFPTETVYGLGADFFNAQAVERMRAVKQRPREKTFTAQVLDIAQAEALCADIPACAYQLMSRFWPGPLTLVFKAKRKAGDSGGTQETIGIRIPANEIARSLIRESGTALAAPSANISGEPAAVTAAEVISVFDGLIEMVIDGGEACAGTASTVVDLTVSPFKILRLGALSREDIEHAVS